MKAYILINVRIGTIQPVIQNLYSISAINTAEMTFGEYDIIAVADVPDMLALAKLISREIQTIPDITATTTCPAIDIKGS